MIFWLAALFLQPDPAMIRRLFEEALARRQSELGAADPRTAQAACDLGLFLMAEKDIPAARRALAEAEDASVSGPALPALATRRKAAGDRAGAAAYLRRALAKAQVVDGGEGRMVALILKSLALVVDPAESARLLQRAREIEMRLRDGQ
ncbi:MAG: hypothetical protein ACRD44_00105 [Bryobacteraceae bacterium]